MESILLRTFSSRFSTPSNFLLEMFLKTLIEVNLLFMLIMIICCLHLTNLNSCFHHCDSNVFWLKFDSNAIHFDWIWMVCIWFQWALDPLHEIKTFTKYQLEYEVNFIKMNVGYFNVWIQPYFWYSESHFPFSCGFSTSWCWFFIRIIFDNYVFCEMFRKIEEIK